jgi:chromosome segregation protein
LQEQVVGFTWKVLQCDTKYSSLFRRLLRGIIITRNLEAARELLAWDLSLSVSSDGDLPFISIVTVGGEVLHVDGWITGGDSKEGGQQGLLAYERELRELPQQVEQLNTTIEQLHNHISEAQRAQEGRKAELAQLDKALQKALAQVNELNKAIASLQREQERLQTEIRLAASVEQQLASEVAGLEQEVLSAQERVHAHEKAQRETRGLVDELQGEMEERAAIYRRQQDELGKARTALAVKRQEARLLRQQLEAQQKQAQDVKAQVERQVARLRENEQQYTALQDAIAGHRTTLEQARSQVHTLSEELQTAEGKLTDVDQHIAAVEQQRIHAQHAKTEQETTYRQALLDSQKARDAVESLLEQLQEEMGVADPGELAQRDIPSMEVSDETVRMPALNSENAAGPAATADADLSEEEEALLRRLRRRVDALRNRLKAMGGCDPEAPQIYEETRTRHEFLTTQINDMEQAALHLRSIIGQLDVTMAHQFEATFQAVNARFREHFTVLFNGGTARLELIAAKSNDEDESEATSMPAGVEVIVQPPGKKVQDLSLLSGGERALVSAALLFSLLEINPPPFCLLDEVDAALDESNVVRFCDILKRLAQRTQFIVITHNRVTMTAAQVIYGVTMKESVSRLLSMRLEEVAAVSN